MQGVCPCGPRPSLRAFSLLDLAVAAGDHVLRHARHVVHLIQRESVIVGIKGHLVKVEAEGLAGAKKLVVLVLVAHVRVAPALVQDPPVLRGDVGAQDGRRELAVAVGRDELADVVQQGAHHGLLVAPGAVAPRGRLQGVLVQVHHDAYVHALERPHHVQHATRLVVALLRVEHRALHHHVLLGALVHAHVLGHALLRRAVLPRALVLEDALRFGQRLAR
eukprot:scaffold198_cov352-Prasinococcus_capsulatus_cf.AAC.4